MNKDNAKPRSCGACSGWLSWLRPPHNEFFERECALHDILYEHGGTEQDRRRADVRLYEDMVRHSIDYYRGRAMPHAQAWFLTLAYLYYLAVRAFGRSRFNYKK